MRNRSIPGSTVVAGILIGLSVLAGWWLDAAILKGVIPFVLILLLAGSVLALRSRWLLWIRRKGQGTLERRIWMALVFCLLSIVVAVVAALFATREFTARSYEMNRVQESRRAAAHLLSTVQDLEVGTRGYALTGSVEFLEPYTLATRSLESAMSDLVGTTQGDVGTAPVLGRITEQVRERLQYAQRVHDAALGDGPDAARTIIAGGAGKASMDSLRAALAELDALQARKLSDHEAEQRESSAQLHRVLVVDTLLALGFTLVFGLLIQGEIARRRRVMREFNAEMEVRVQERTEDLQRFAHIVRSASDMLAFRDRDNRFVLVNESYCRYFGLGAGEIIGRTPDELFLTTEYRQLMGPLGSRCLEGERVSAEGWVTYPGMGRRYMELRYDPFLDANGVVQGMVVAARDMTDRHESEEHLRASEARLKTVAELGSDLIFEASIDSDEVTWFGDVDALLGMRTGVAPRTLKGWLENIHEEDRRRVASAVQTQLQRPGADFTEEYRMTGADGGEHWWHVRARLLPVDGGTRRNWVGSVRDVTQHRNIEKQLAQAQKMEAVGQLTGGVAHDFNNRLTTILGSLELLQRQLADRPDSLRLISMAIRAVEGGASLTRQLLTFSRRQVLESQVLSVTHCIHSIVPLLRQTLGEDIDVRFVQHEPPWPIKTDPALLENALLNLGLNARDAMSGGGKIIIETRNVLLEGNYLQEHAYANAGEHVLVTVSDTGSGIPREVLHHVLEPFFTTKEPGRGTGLGLSMVYGFMRQSGGHVEIYSEEGHGTSVKLYFPRHTGALPARVSVDTGGSEGLTSHHRILVVEDDESVRRLAATQLQELGYQVIEADSGPAALRMADELSALDLLFTDVIMPGGMTGVDLAAGLRRRWPELEVIFTSGYTQRKVQAQWVEHGPRDHWLPKPYSFSTLASMIGAIVRGGVAPQ